MLAALALCSSPARRHTRLEPPPQARRRGRRSRRRPPGRLTTALSAAPPPDAQAFVPTAVLRAQPPAAAAHASPMYASCLPPLRRTACARAELREDWDA